MTFALHGIPVSKGIAIGKAVLISRAALEVSHHLIEAGKEEAEAQKLLDAFNRCVRMSLMGFSANAGSANIMPCTSKNAAISCGASFGKPWRNCSSSKRT